MTESLEIEIIDIKAEPIIKERKYRRAEWRHNLDGSYNNKPTDPEYFKTYWRTHYKKEYICPHCDKKLLNIEKIKRHELSHLCIKAKNKKLETEKQDF